MYKHHREHRGEAQRKKKRKLLNRRHVFLLNTLQFDWEKKKQNISNQFSKVIKHAWILFTFKLSVGSCSSTNVPEKLCSLVLQLPVESSRTKSLPAMHMHHALKEWTCLLGQWASLVMVCTDNLHSCRAAFLQTPLFPPSATRQMIFRTDQAKAKWKR